jgi:VCBS repeat-containing protein
MSSNRIRGQFSLFDEDRFHDADAQAVAAAHEAAQHHAPDLAAEANLMAPHHHDAEMSFSAQAHASTLTSHAHSGEALVRSTSHVAGAVDDTFSGIGSGIGDSATAPREIGDFGSSSFIASSSYDSVSDARASGDAFGISHGFDSSGARGAPPPVTQVTGQLWFGAQGETGGTSSGFSDDQVGHIDSDGGGRSPALVNTEGVSQGFQSVGLDTSAGLFFALDGDHTLRSARFSTSNQSGEAQQIQETQTQFGTGTSADEVNAIAVDPVNHIIYVEIFGQTDNTTALVKVTYDPVTGAFTYPYNTSTGTITDSSKVVMTNTSTGGVLTDVTAMHYDMASHLLYYVDDDLGYHFNGGANQTWVATKNIYVVDPTAANAQPTQLTTGLNASDANTYIAGMAVDTEKSLIYYTVNNISAHTTQFFYMSITGGASTAMTLPGGTTFEYTAYYGNGSNAMALDDLAQAIYVSDNGHNDSAGGHIVKLTLSADGHSFTAGTVVTTLDSNDQSSSNVGALVFDNLPVLNGGNHTLSATTTEAVQGGSAITLLTGAGITITDSDDNHLGYATVKITNAQTGDVLSASTAGTSITASYNTTTHTLTLTGDDTYAHYIQVMNAVQFQDTGTDNSTGSHPTRTVVWTVSDGTTIVDSSTNDPNVASTTVVIDRAPTLATDNYAILEGATASGTSGTAGTGVLGNDNDKDADSITVTAVQGSGANVGNSVAGTYGHLTLNSNGSFSYQADNTSQIDAAATGSHPVDTFTYTVSDGLGGVTTSTVSFTIDRAPTVVADAPATQALESGSAVTGNVLTNDSDKDGDTLTVSAVNGSGGNVGTSLAGTYGHITINSNGTYSYTADNTAQIDAGATGSHLTDTFTYTDSDGHGGTTTTTITVTIDRAPTVVADAPSSQAIESGSAVTGNVLTNDSDRDGDTLVVSAVQGSAGNVGNSIATTYGHITINSNGSYSYTADNTTAINAAATGSHLTETVTYTASDGHGGTTTTNLVVTLDRGPTVTADAPASQALESGSAVGGNVLTNDSDRDGDTLVVSAVAGSAGNVGNSVATTYGHITVNADGSYSYTADNTTAIDAAATGSHLTDTVSYTASDGHGGTTTTNIVVTLDRGPTVVADAPNAMALESAASVAGNALTNDSDRDGDTLVVSAVAGSAGNVGNSVAMTYGHITVNSDGTYVYFADNTAAIDAAATGSHLTDTITYTASDGHGGTATQTITVTIDRAPTVVADAPSSQAIESGAAVTGNVLSNDSDRDGDSLTVVQVNGSAGNVGGSVAGTYGHITVNADGTYSYTADNTAAIDAAATGSHLTETFTYRASDGNDGSTASTITITLDRGPTVVADAPASQALESGSAVAANALTNDSDRDGDTLVVSAVAGSAGNVGNSVATTYGHITVNADGSYSYTADNTTAIDAAATGSHLTDTVSYTVSDGHGGTATTNIVVTLDRAPTVVSDAPSGQALESGLSVGGNVLSNDSDRDGDILAVSAVNGSGANVGNSVAGTYGNITINADGSYSYVANNTAAIDAAATGSHLTDTFSYTADDGHGGTTTTDVVITLDRGPTAVADAPTDQALESGSAVTGNVLTNDSDRDGDTLVVDTAAGSAGNVGNSVATTYGHITINADGTYSYVADNTAAIDGAATGSHLTELISYTINDGHGGTSASSITVTLDRGPTAANDSVGGFVAESGSTSQNAAGGVLANDSDRDGDTLVVSAVAGSAGNVGTSIATTYGHITVNADGSYSYTADNTTAIDAAATGSHPTDVISITVDDGHGGTTTETLSIAIDRPTVGTADSLSTTESAAAVNGSNGNANLLANDSDPDGDNFAITQVNGSAGNVGTQITLASGALLTVNANGTYSYDPNHVFDYLPDAANSGASNTTATDSFTYTLTGGEVVTVTVTINGQDSNDILQGTAGNDLLHGGLGDDQIHALAGVDQVFGDSGNDYIDMANNLTSADSIDGGTGLDRVYLNGDYSAGVTFSATTMVNVELINLTAGNSYNLTTNDATVASGQTLTIQAGSLGAGDAVTFNGGAETNGSFIINTGAGNDVLTGGALADQFFSGSGNDTIHGGGGNDTIGMGANLTAADSIDGGTGSDTVVLNGDYAAGVIFGTSTITNVENLQLAAGFSYNLTTSDATVASGQTLTIKADTLGAGDALTFNGAAETNGSFVINSGAGNDVLTGGDGNDTFRPGTGNDTVHAGGGADTINMGAGLTASDSIDGGTGSDMLFLAGDYSSGVTFGATTVTNIETMFLATGFNYTLAINNATVTAGNFLTVQAAGLGAGNALNFDGSADTTGGTLNVIGGAGDDHLTGGHGDDTLTGNAGNDVFTGGLGSDTIYGGPGSDTFVYNSVADSTSDGRDKIKDFDAASDHFQLNGISVNAINAEVMSGKLTIAHFDTDLAAAIDGNHLGAHDAVLFTPDSGSLHGHIFLVVDVNGVAGYQAGQDLVFDITGATNLGSLSIASFMTGP